jgi:TetR/AcrR family transcriptional regulator, repressor for uid operon
MPKVLPEYLEQRRHQILDAAAACFSRNGFHQTSMHDICTEAELSPGAVYRYFGSKEEIIGAISDTNHEQDLAVVEEIKSRGATLEVLSELANEFFLNLRDERSCLSLDLWAEATRNDAIKETLKRANQGYRESFAGIVRRSQALGEINPNLNPDSVARIFCALFHGFILQRTLDPNFSVEDYVTACKAMIGGEFWIGP